MVHNQQTTTQQQAPRTPYRTPKLLHYGQLASLTAGGTTPLPTELATIAVSLDP